jgi:hypothetical protein
MRTDWLWSDLKRWHSHVWRKITAAPQTEHAHFWKFAGWEILVMVGTQKCVINTHVGTPGIKKLEKTALLAVTLTVCQDKNPINLMTHFLFFVICILLSL